MKCPFDPKKGKPDKPKIKSNFGRCIFFENIINDDKNKKK
jgi:hypothetical protein